MKKRYSFLLIIISLLFLLTACGKTEYTFYRQMGDTVGLSSIEEACETLGISQSELEEKQAAKKKTVNYTLTSCFELLPDSIQVDTAELYITVDQGFVMGAQLYAVCENADYDPAQVYRICKAECERLADCYPENAFDDRGFRNVSQNGKKYQPLLEMYPDEESFLAAYDAMQADGDFFSGMDVWWVDKENEVTFTFQVRLSAAGVSYTWTAVDEAARTDYLLRRS